MSYNDSELDVLPTCPDCKRVLVTADPHLCDGVPPSLWPWIALGITVAAISGLILLAILFHQLAHPANPPSLTPTMEVHK